MDVEAAVVVVEDVIGKADTVVDVVLATAGEVVDVVELHDANSNDVTKRRLSDA